MTSAIGSRRLGRGTVGFTLLELCLAGSVIGLMAALCWPSLRRYSRRLSLDARADAVLQRLVTAREQAILSGHPQTVEITGPDVAAPAAAEFFPDGSARFVQVDLRGGGATGVRLTVEDSGRIEVQDDVPSAV